MKTLFTIGEEKRTSDCLLIEFGQDFCCYAFLDRKEKQFEVIRYVSFDEWEAAEGMTSLVRDLASENFPDVILCSTYSHALLLPQSHFRENYSLLNAIYDLPHQKHLHDTIPEWQMTAIYSMPLETYDILNKSFTSSRFFHAYTPALKIYNGFVAPDQIDIHFTTHHFRVLVKKDQQVQLAQTYSYKMPLDVVYFLLKICSEFQLEQTQLFLIVSGLIDQDSALFNELHHYFLNVHFAQAPAYSLPEHDHPHYYFTSLYNLASCAS